ncbi:MAG TPA: glycosyltransferase [Steroidobacteraceae bacterium]|nr:glycosyltransferase [Steroidobacteraceae bacterium]
MHAEARALAAREAPALAWRPKPHFYLTVLAVWLGAVAWFHPHFGTLLGLGDTLPAKLAVWFFVLFIDVAWAYAAYNIAVIAYGTWYRRRARARPAEAALEPAELPQVALLYTTCNDFAEEPVLSCMAQDYARYRVYILDDSTDEGYRQRIDAFATQHGDRVRVVRRRDRRGFKAGNLNHALSTVAREPLFALVDADEILPPDFLQALVPRLLATSDCGFIQATHRSNPGSKSPLARDLGCGVDSHWRWYHPLRNDYGFVMLLGHGALIRRQAWTEAGGFPEIVSEDLAFALRAREAGWRGRFAEDVLCYEEFPEDVRAFRVRHMKWTRGTCEFLAREGGRLLRSRRITWVEKLDILLPTLNLPLSFLFFLFVIDANLVLTNLYGEIDTMTWVIAGSEWRVPVVRLDPAFEVLNRSDLFIVTLLALVSPVLCFVIDLWRQPLRLWSFLAKSTALYGALGPLSSIGVVLFGLTGRAVFHVTADRSAAPQSASRRGERTRTLFGRAGGELRQFAQRSHPDHPFVQLLELACGATLVVLACASVQLPFLGLALGYFMLPLLHHCDWNARPVQAVVQVPFVLIVAGVLLGSLSLIGVQTVFFGYGFHF